MLSVCRSLSLDGTWLSQVPESADGRATGLEAGERVTIEGDVWIGGGAIICPGVTIGSGSVIGAGAVVTRDIPPGVFAAGNPARVIRAIEKGLGPPTPG
jgi:maltose O-acetyltransferase